MAVITNSICTNNQEIDIQSGTGALSIATKAAATNIVLGNTSSTTGLTINLGSGGLTIPTLNSYGSLVTTNAGLISDAAAGTSGTILTSNGTSSLPGYAALLASSVTIDNSTIIDTVQFSSIGATVATGSSPQDLTFYTISGTSYITVINQSTFSTYSWSGTAWVSIGAAISPGFTLHCVNSFVISGTQYLAITTNTAASGLLTYSWNGSTFVLVGSALATTYAGYSLTNFVISSTQYLAVTSNNSISADIQIFSWNGSAFTLLGSVSGVTATAVGNGPTIVSYVISGTQYISYNDGNQNLITYSWNGSAFVLVATDAVLNAAALYLTTYTISGTQYISTANQGNNTFSTYSWNGTHFVSIGGNIKTGSTVYGITSYTIGTSHYISVTNNNALSKTVSTYIWNGTTFIKNQLDVATGTTPRNIISYVIGTTSYLSCTNNTSTSLSTYKSGANAIQMTGVFPASITTAPVASSTATAAFGTTLTLSTATQNTTGYDILLNISVDAASSTNGVLSIGVDNNSTPGSNAIIKSITSATEKVYNFAVIVPNNYYVILNKSGTMSVNSITIQSCAM